MLPADVSELVADTDKGEFGDVRRAAAKDHPLLIGITDDPIVSSDVIGCRQSLLFDSKATLKAGKNIVKVLAWYESLGHACRVLDVVRRYGELDGDGGVR